MEVAVLGWALTFAAVTAGAFLIARSLVQIGSVAYDVLEKRLDRRAATRQTVVLSTIALAALAITAGVAALALLAVLAGLLEGNTF